MTKQKDQWVTPVAGAPHQLRRQWSWRRIAALTILTAVFGNTLQAQPPLPEPVRPLPTVPTVQEPILPPFKSGQAELLKSPCLPGQDLSTAPCDQNAPGVACPSSSDLAQKKKFLDQILDPKDTLTLYVGRTRLLLLKETPRRVQIGDDKIAGYTLITPKEISLLGTTLGTTVLNLWFTDPTDKKKENVLGFLVRVIPDPEEKARLDAKYKKLQVEIQHAFPDSRVCLTLVGDKLVVSGQVKDVAEATQILRIARSNAPRVENKYGEFTPPAFAPGATARDRMNELQNWVGSYVINLLRIPGEQQVMMRVTVAEINRAALRSIGLNFSFTNNHGIQVFANNTGAISGTTTGVGAGLLGSGLSAASSVAQSANNLPTILDNGQIPLAINALRNLNYARSLAEPNLVALNGETASFQAGGQFPVPVVTGQTFSGLQGVQFVNYGVSVNFTPFITDRDRVRLNISAAVSTKDLSSATNIGGATVPGLNTRNFVTIVEMREGQTLAVAGLIQNNLSATASRIPLFGDIPILNRVLGFDQITAGEQELVILVTPEVVHPLCADEVPPLPGSDLFEPGDLEFYLLGRLESRRPYDYRSPVMTDIHRMLRYHRCEQVYIFGPSGHSEDGDSK